MAEHEVWYCQRLVACVEYDVAQKLKFALKMNMSLSGNNSL